MAQPLVLVVGTRAEAIKLIPVYKKLKEVGFSTLLCATFQHSELLQQVFSAFGITPDFNLNIMKHNQDLFYLTQEILEKTKQVFESTKPALVMVHGDTTTTFASALSAFYLHIPIAHVEAGLRTGDMQAPFPEEMNRKVVGQIADYNFAPTAFSTANLLSEGIPREKVFCTGNTIVDAVHWIKKAIQERRVVIDDAIAKQVEQCKRERKKMILLTAHRRESFNGGLKRIFSTMKKFANEHDDVTIFYPFHPNPHVISAIKESEISSAKNIIMYEPLAYKDLMYLLMNVDFVATDSGGIQEEAVSLGKFVLVLRDKTERWEGVWEGSEILVGTNETILMNKMKELYKASHKMQPSHVYGDGKSSEVIATILQERLSSMGEKENKHLSRPPLILPCRP